MASGPSSSSSLRVKELKQSGGIRSMLERLATRLAARSLREAKPDTLGGSVTELRAADPGPNVEFTRALHGLIHEAAGRPRFSEKIDRPRETAAADFSMNVTQHDEQVPQIRRAGT
jgi:DNA-binding GntR family transcriptional regulator